MDSAINTNKHIEDNGDVLILVNDKGEALVLCLECKKKWFIKFDPIVEAEDSRRLGFRNQISANQYLLTDLKVDIDKLDL